MRFVTTQGEAPADVARVGALRRARPGRQPLHAGGDRPAERRGDRRSSVAVAGGDWHPRPPALHRRRNFRGDAGGDRRRGAEFSDSAGRSRAGCACARALSRADARLQGHRRPRHGASDFGAARSRSADVGPGGHLWRYRKRGRARVLPRTAYPRHRALSRRTRQPTAGSAVDDVQCRAGHQRPRLRDRRQLRRLPAAGEGGVRRPGPARSRATHVGQFDQHRAAAAADGLLLPPHRAAGARERIRPRRRLDAERQLRQPDRRSDGEAGGAADRPVRGGDQHQRRGARRI